MLQGINNQSDLYSAYNRIQQRRFAENEAVKLNSSQADLVKSNQNAKQTISEENLQSAGTSKMDLRLDSIKPRKEMNVEDISLSLNNSNVSGFEMKGRQSDLDSLDIEKAVSDMQKDKALMQYQYFVGESNPFSASPDGIVIAK